MPALGMKKPTTTEPKKILPRSRSNLEIDFI